MTLTRSLLGFGRAIREDAAFRRLGRPPGWSVYFHYRGRWRERRGREMPGQRVEFVDQGRRVEFEMSEKYLGAFKGVFVDREYDCATRLPVAPRRILDLGGNIGFGSVFLAGLFPAATFGVVEPDPRNLPLLRRNLVANGIAARVIAGAIGPESGALRLRFGNDPTCSSLEGTGMHVFSNSVEVAVTTVPNVMKELGWDRVDLLKIDIEGAEEDLLARRNEWLTQVGAILVEVHPNTTAERLNHWLAPHGFNLVRFGTGREPVYFATRKVA
jgi:FkbM family methyltransferase